MKSFLDVQKRTLWDPRLLSAQVLRQIDSNSRTSQLSYLSPANGIFEGADVTVKESWHDLGNRSYAILVKSAQASDQTFEAALVISPVDSSDTSLYASTDISLFTKTHIHHSVKFLLERFCMLSFISPQAIFGLNAHLKTLNRFELNRVRLFSPGSAQQESGNSEKSLDQERKFRETLKQVLSVLLKEKNDNETYKVVYENKDVQVLKKTTITEKTMLAIKASIRMEQKLEVVMNFIADITKYHKIHIPLCLISSDQETRI
jgi:hypothetical protein